MTVNGSMTTSRARMAIGALAIAMSAGVLAACGSSSSSNDSATASSSSDGGAQSATVTRACASRDKYLPTPTAIPQTDPLKAAPASGKSVIYLVQPGNPNNSRIGQGVQAAAKAAGWSYSQVTYDPSNPASLQAGLKSALAKHPTAVAVNGSEQSQFGAGTEAAYAKAGVPIVMANTGPQKLDNTILGLPNGPAAAVAQATALASWFVCDSGGKGHVLVSHVLGFTYVDVLADKFVSTVKATCPDCVVKVKKSTLSQFGQGQLPTVVSSAVRQAPDVKYLFLAEGAFSTGIDAALKSAGVKDVKVIGADLGPANAAALRDGTNSVWTGQNLLETGYAMMDVVFRRIQGMPMSSDSFAPVNSPPVQLLTKATLGASDHVEVPTDALDQYKKLWKVAAQ
jgi:ABC-type sugar transport system substrate-binding protein